MKNRMSKLGVTLAVFFATSIALAGFQGFNGTSSLGLFTTLKCSTGLTCTKSGGVMTVVATSEDLELENAEAITNSTDDTVQIASDDAAIVLSLYSPLTSNGDASLLLSADASADNGDDWEIQHDGATNDLLFRNDKSGSQATFYTFSEDGDVTFAGTTPLLTMGDAGEEDAGIAFNGAAQDFHISLDDSSDDLVIGLGTAAGTTDAIRIDENQNVTVVQGLAGLGTDTFVGFLHSTVTATATTLTAAQCGSTFINSGAIEVELPEASTVVGCRYTFIVNNATAFNIDPDAGDQIWLLTNAAGDRIVADAVGESVVLQAVDAAGWAPISTQQGTWTDNN